MFLKQKQKISRFVTNILEDRWVKHQPQPVLGFSVHLAEHCNLNCRACAHFSPLCKEEFANFNEFSKDMERLSELSNGEMRYIDLIGGEPLLNKNISSFIKKARECFPIGHVRIITNGLLLRQMDDIFWERVCVDRCDICVSKYNNNIDYDSLMDYIRHKGGGMLVC